VTLNLGREISKFYQKIIASRIRKGLSNFGVILVTWFWSAEVVQGGDLWFIAFSVFFNFFFFCFDVLLILYLMGALSSPLVI